MKSKSRSQQNGLQKHVGRKVKKVKNNSRSKSDRICDNTVDDVRSAFLRQKQIESN